MSGAADYITPSVNSAATAEVDVALAYVGQVVPEEARFHTASFERSGQMLQTNLLAGLKHAGLYPSAIISALPIPAFPRSRCLWVSGAEVTIPGGMRASLVPFLNVTPLKQLSIGIATVSHLLRWAWRFRRARSRVIFTYNLSVPPGLFTLLAARLIGAKCLVGIFDINVPGQTVPNNLWFRIDYLLQRLLLPRYDGHVAVTDSVMRDFAPGRHYLRLEGIISKETLERTRPQPKRNMTSRPFTIVAAGTLNEANGIPEMLKAFSMLTGDFYRLVIAGDGPLRKSVQDAAVLDPRIQYLGYLQFEDVLELYKKAELLVCMRMTKTLNTRYFFPSKIMEYLASGVPVVSTCTNHLEEEFKGLLYLLKDETPAGLATLIADIAAIPAEQRREVAEKARTFIASHKTWQVQGQRLAEYMTRRVVDK